MAQAEEVAALTADLQAVQGDLAAAAQHLHSRLQQLPDDWGAMRAYLDCLLPSTAASPLPHASSLLWFEGGAAQLLWPTASNSKLPAAPGLQLDVVQPAAGAVRPLSAACGECTSVSLHAAAVRREHRCCSPAVQQLDTGFGAGSRTYL